MCVNDSSLIEVSTSQLECHVHTQLTPSSPYPPSFSTGSSSGLAKVPWVGVMSCVLFPGSDVGKAHPKTQPTKFPMSNSISEASSCLPPLRYLFFLFTSNISLVLGLGSSCFANLLLSWSRVWIVDYLWQL